MSVTCPCSNIPLLWLGFLGALLCWGSQPASQGGQRVLWRTNGSVFRTRLYARTSSDILPTHSAFRRLSRKCATTYSADNLSLWRQCRCVVLPSVLSLCLPSFSGMPSQRAVDVFCPTTQLPPCFTIELALRITLKVDNLAYKCES